MTTRKTRQALMSACFAVLFVVPAVVSLGSRNANAAAGIPPILNYQARVTNASGAPITAATDMRFIIYDAASGGNCVWSGWGTGTNGCGAPEAGSVSVTPVSGVFSLALGDTAVSSQKALPSDIFNDDSRYLAIEMYNGSAWETLSPRKRILAAPYAFNSNLLNGLSSSAAGGTNAHVVATDAGGKLTVGGGAAVTGGAITLTANTDSTWSTSSGALTLDAAAALNLGTANATSVSIGKSGVTTTVNGALTVTQALTANGDIAFGSGNITGASPLSFDGATADAVKTVFAIADPTGSSKTITFPNATGTVAVSASAPLAIDAAGNITCASCIVTAATLQSAYNAGQTIVTSSSHDIAFTLTSGNFTASGAGSVNLTPTGASSFTSGGALTLTGAATSTWSTSAGDLNLTGAGALNLTATNGNSAWKTTAGTLTIQSGDNTASALTINTANVAGGTGGISIVSGNASGGNSGAVSLDAGTASGTVGTVSLGNTNATTVSIGGTAATAINIGAGGALTRTIAIGTGTGVDTISIGTGATGADLITIGSTNAGASSFKSGAALTLTAGADSTWSTSSGALTLTSARSATWSTAAGDLAVTGAGALNLTATNGNSAWKTTAGTLTIQSGDSTASALTINTANVAGGTGGIKIASGNASGGTAGNLTLDVGTSSSGAPAIGIGSTAATSIAKTITIGAADQTGTITLGQSTAAQNISIGSANSTTGAQTIAIANGTAGANAEVDILSGVGTAGAGTVKIGDNTRTAVIDLGNVTAAAARAITIGGGNNGVVDTINIGNGNGTAAGAETINIGAGTPTGSGSNLVTVGSTALASALTLQAGTGNMNLSVGSTGTINVGGNAVAKTINIGQTGAGTGADTVNIGTSGVAKTITVGTGTAGTADTVNIANAQTGGAVSIGGAMTTGTIAIGGAETSGTISIGGGSSAMTGNITIGSTGMTSGVLKLLGGTGTGALGGTTSGIDITPGTAGTINIGASAGTGQITLGSSSAAQTVAIGAGAGAATISIGTGATNAKTISIGTGAVADLITIGSASAGASSFTSGAALTLTAGAASTWGTSSGNLMLNAAGTGTGSVVIGTGSASNTPDLLVLDVKNTATDPTGTVGAMYYNSNAGKFRCFQAAAWADCINANTSTLQTAYNAGATITTASSTAIAFTLTSGNFNVTGAGSVNLTPTGASQFTSAGALTLTGAAASVWSTSAGALTITGNASIAVDSATTGAVTVGANANAKTVTIGNATGATALNLTSGTGAQTFTSSNASGTTTGSAFVMNAGSLTSGTALYLTSTSTSGRLLDMNLTNTTGTAINADYGAPTTQGAGALTGLSLDFNTNLATPAAAQPFIGVDLKLPAASTTSNDAVITGFNLSTAGAITNGTAGTMIWRGAQVAMPNITMNAGGNVVASAYRITTGTITNGGTMNGVNIVAQGVAAGTLNGINIAGITAGAGTENAIQIGAGYDNGILFAGAGTITTGAGSALTIKTGTTGALTLDSGSSGGVNIGNGATGKTIILGNTTGGTSLTINTPAAGITLNGKGTVQASGTLPVCFNGSNVLYNGSSATTCISSSRRYKHDIQNLPASLGLEAVRRLDPVSFVYNDTNLPYLGFIAEDVAAIDTRPISYLDGQINGIDWGQILPIVTQGVKDLDAVVTALKAGVDVAPDGSALAVTGKLDLGATGLSLASDAAGTKISFADNAGNEVGYLTAAGDLALRGRLYLGAAGSLQSTGYLELDAAGRVNAAAGFAAGQAGYAEAFASDAPIAPGTLVAVDPNDASKVRPAEADDAVVGVASDEAGFVAGASPTAAVSVVVAGRALVRVTGDLAPGDAIAIADAGVGVKRSAASGAVAGYALESHAGADEGLIKAIVAPGFRGVEAPPVAEASVSGGGKATFSLAPGADLDAGSRSFVSVFLVQGIEGRWSIDENGILKTIAVSGGQKTAQPDLALYAEMGDGAKLEFAGTARLAAGRVHIGFSADEQAVIDASSSFEVFVTLNSDRDRLYVANKTATGFDVVSNIKTDSTSIFDWVVMAVRKGYAGTAAAAN